MTPELETRPVSFEPREELGSLGDMLARTVAAFGDRPALRSEDEQITYAELYDRSRRLAAGLAAEGLTSGDPVALLLPNTPDFVASFFAVARLGAVSVPLSPHLKDAELDFYFRESRVRGVIAEPRRLAAARRITSKLDRPVVLVSAAGTERHALSIAGLERHAETDLPEPASSSHAMFQYSAGSTGRPKRVPRTHAQLCTEAESLVGATGIAPDDTILAAVPLFHTYGIGCCLAAAMRSGASLRLLHERQPFALSRRRALELLGRGEATVFPAVPFMLRLLAEAPGTSELSRLRLCFSAAAALPPSTFDAFRERFGIDIRQLYGCTEAGTIAANIAGDAVATARSVGRPLDHVDIRIIDGDGAPQERGRIGEIAVRSGAMMRGYASAEDLDQAIFSDGYFRTGDRGRVDDDGLLYITGRTKLLIDVSGDKVDPIEVEDVLATHPKVREVVVVGVPTPRQNEELVKAVVVAEGACTETELVRFARERLANYKVPHRVEFRDEIPKSADGTPLRKYLVD
jgi:long-chain acyl-CoA synthetase